MDLDQANIQKALKHTENNKPKENQSADKTRPTPISRVQDKNDWTDLTPYFIFLSKIRLKPDPNQTQTRLKPELNQT